MSAGHDKLMTEQHVSEWIESVQMVDTYTDKKRDEIFNEVMAAKNAGEQRRIMAKYDKSLGTQREAESYITNEPKTQQALMDELLTRDWRNMPREQLGTYAQAMGFISSDMPDSTWYKGIDDFRRMLGVEDRYKKAEDAAKLQADIQSKRNEIADEIYDNSFHLLSPKESMNKFFDSDDKWGYVQNSILNGFFPILTDRMVGQMRNGEGPTRLSQIGAGDLGALVSDIGIAALLGGGGKAAGGGLRSIARLPAKTTLQELLGAAGAGGLAGALQTVALDNLGSTDQTAKDYFVNTLLGAGTNAIASPVMFKTAGDYVKAASKGLKGNAGGAIKATADALENMGNSVEARAGDYMADKLARAKSNAVSPAEAFVNSESRNEIKALVERAKAGDIEAFNTLRNIGIDPELPMEDIMKSLGSEYKIGAKLDAPYSPTAMQDAADAVFYGNMVREGTVGMNAMNAKKPLAPGKQSIERAEAISKHEPIKEWYSVFDPNDTWVKRSNTMSDIGSGSLDLLGLTPDIQVWRGRTEPEEPKKEDPNEVQKAKEKREKDSYNRRNRMMGKVTVDDSDIQLASSEDPTYYGWSDADVENYINDSAAMWSIGGHPGEIDNWGNLKDPAYKDSLPVVAFMRWKARNGG